MEIEKKGKLYIFFGPSGIGKDYVLNKFIDFGKNNSVPISLVTRYFTRVSRENEINDEYHSYGNNITDVCNPDNIFSKINGEYVGINRGQVKTSLDLGENLALATGSIDLIEQIQEEFKDNPDNLCLIFVNAPGLSMDYYVKLEKSRNPNLSMDKIFASATERWKQSELINNYCKQNNNSFDYAYLNITKNANRSISDQFSDVFVTNFFKVIINGENESGPNWICTGRTSNNIKKDRDSFER